MRDFLKLNRIPKIANQWDKLFCKANVFRFCDKKLRDTDDKVKHYCKLSGNYLGAAHQSCIDYGNKDHQQKFIPVLYHTFSQYGNHMFFNDLIISKVDKIKLSVIPRTNEEYMCVRYGCVKFLDSMRFHQYSLEKIRESINDHDYIHLKRHFPNHWMLLKKKIAYPYEFFRSLEDYEKPIDEFLKSGKEAYFSIVKNKRPDQEEKDRTNEIIKFFNIENGRELTELYNKADVILVADIFEKFLEVSLSEFGINPLYHISLPGTTCSKGLRYTGAELELFKNVDLFQLFENGMRGGVSGVFGDRFIESNNNIKILHIKMSNLYGFAMLQHLPIGNFQIYENNSITESFVNRVLNIHDCSDIGYVLLVDLIYRDTIKHRSKIFSFCPEKKIIHPNNFYRMYERTYPQTI